MSRVILLDAGPLGLVTNPARPTADPRELQCDVIIAAQALTMGAPAANLIVATTNIGHLAQFLAAESWATIVP